MEVAGAVLVDVDHIAGWLQLGVVKGKAYMCRTGLLRGNNPGASQA
jgi:hypothetical protein